MKNKIFEEDLERIYKGINNKSFFKKKKILITGSNGFIGFYLSSFFISYFEKLKLSKIYLLDKNLKNITTKNKKIVYIKKNVVNFDLSKLNLDIIVHAASIASPSFYRKFPLETCNANVKGIEKILSYGKLKKKTSILFFSSSEIYGDPDLNNIPTKEDYRGNVSCTGPRACYDESKRYAETLCYIYAKYYNVSVKVIRPFNNYGPGLKTNDGRAPADFANSVLTNKNMILFSNGLATRSFCYITDACIGYINALSISKYLVLNIGNKIEISILELARIFAAIGKKYHYYNKKIIFKKNKDKNYNIDSPNRRCPNLSLAKKTISYNPKINIAEGVKRYLDFLKYEKI